MNKAYKNDEKGTAALEYGLIGEKLAHSYSAELHKALAKYDYRLCELAPSELDGFMRKADFSGINVTIPYKKAVMPYLYEIDKKALAIGAVNTVVKQSGKLYGYNTDYYGLLALLEKIGISVKGKKCMILGTGGTSNTARAVLSNCEASEITVVSRTPGNDRVSYEQALELSDIEIIINTTPCGMYPRPDECPIDLSAFPKLCGVVDAIYNPLRTKLVSEALARGIRAEGGLYMLAAQAYAASRLFSGNEPLIDAKEVEKAFDALCRQKENIVLVGMPSCGKTTVGKIVSDTLGRSFFDTDDMFFEKYKITAGEFIRKNGEEAFRLSESDIIAKASNTSGAVISTGGGAVLRKTNVDALKRNGKIYFIDRPLEELICGGDRPLSGNRDALSALYERRYPLYEKCCDRKIISDGTADEAAKKICSDWIIRGD